MRSHSADLTAIHEPDTLITDYKLTTQIIEVATNAATTMTTRVLKCKTVSADLLILIKARKYAARAVKNAKPDDPLLINKKTHYNKLTNIIKKETKATQEAQWLNFCKSLHSSRKYSTDYWKKIRQIST